MKFSYQWLRELVPDLSVQPLELQRSITMKTAECEGIVPVGAHFATVIAAEVISVEPVGSGKNKRVRIRTGSGSTAEVVCGAPNVQVGMIAPWIPPGTNLDGKTIGEVVIEGVRSYGMLASAADLCLSRDHSGLLSVPNVAPGEPLPGLAPDWIIDIDNKSLTHRPDLWGHYGMAREVAAITGGELCDPVHPEALTEGPSKIKVEIIDRTLCPRYSAAVVEKITVGPSPLWLQARLQNIGLNPINNIVDVTNFVLAELPQPMHAFDADKLQGDTIFVRTAKHGEQLLALNGENYSLTPADLIIADAAGPIAVAGVIGGAASAISDTTTRVVLESANFNAASVRLTSVRLRLRTDASVRFEKSLDPANTVRGLARAIELISEVSPGSQPSGGIADDGRPAETLPSITISTSFISRKLGKALDTAEVISIFESLGFAVSPMETDVLSITVPSWRATKDVSVKDDLVEEIGRMIGYAEITPVPPLAACSVPPADPMRLYVREVRAQMAAQGFTEIYNYSFVTEAEVARLGMNIADHLLVRNPIASELSHLRRSLLPGVFENILTNVRHFPDFSFFEIGREIHPDEEQTHLAAATYHAGGDDQDFFELKRTVECLFPGARLVASAARQYEHPMRASEIRWRETIVGRLFEWHPSLLRAEGLEGRAFSFDVDLMRAYAEASRWQMRYVPLRRYPTSGFDLSVVTSLRVPVDSIQDELSLLGGTDLAMVDFVRQYAGPPLPEGQKSVSYHLEVGAADRTLTTDEVTAIRNRIIDGMRERGFDLRV